MTHSATENKVNRASQSLTNRTGNQHFISQVEQRLNATNPSAPKEQQRIFAFDIATPNREPCGLTPRRRRAGKIANNLSCLDLFSFSVDAAREYRENLEHVFGLYEAEVRVCTESLLQKCAVGGTQDLKREIVDIFAAKLMNLVRSPLSFRQGLNLRDPLVSS